MKWGGRQIGVEIEGILGVLGRHIRIAQPQSDPGEVIENRG